MAKGTPRLTPPAPLRRQSLRPCLPSHSLRHRSTVHAVSSPLSSTPWSLPHHGHYCLCSLPLLHASASACSSSILASGSCESLVAEPYRDWCLLPPVHVENCGHQRPRSSCLRCISASLVKCITQSGRLSSRE